MSWSGRAGSRHSCRGRAPASARWRPAAQRVSAVGDLGGRRTAVDRGIGGCHDSSMRSTGKATQVAVVTGASRGIGRLIALSLARSGMTVIAISRPSEDLNSLQAEAHGSHLRTYAADVTDPAQVQRAFRQAVSDAGPPRLLVTCAGSADALGPIATVDPDRWWRTVSVDLRGTMLCAQAALKWMLPVGAGRIVTIYGNLGDRGTAHVSAFAAAKAAIARFTETLATELDGTGVVALTIHPGFIRTPMTEHLAWSDDGQQWLPEFGQRAEHHWGDGALTAPRTHPERRRRLPLRSRHPRRRRPRRTNGGGTQRRRCPSSSNSRHHLNEGLICRSDITTRPTNDRGHAPDTTHLTRPNRVR